MPIALEKSTELVKSVTLTPGEIRFYQAEGYLVIPNVMTSDVVERVCGRSQSSAGP